MTMDAVTVAALDSGRVRATLEAPDLTGVEASGVELLRRVGVRVRDPAWGTVPADVEDVAVTARGARFEASFAARHRAGDIDFAWRCAVAGSSAGLSYEMDGAAHGDFGYARIGIVLLHPPEVTAGRPFRARGPDGRSEGVLPRLVGPQLVTDGVIQPLFAGFEELEIDVTPALTLVFELEGDVFEMEDQRNWTDASFKTYSTPVGLPVPHHAHAGQRFRQRVRVHVRGDAPAARQRAPARPSLVLGDPLGRRFPPVGTTLATAPSAADRALLAALAPAHLRVELPPAADLGAGLATATAAAPDMPLELALWLPPGEEAARERLGEIAEVVAAAAPPLARVVVHRAGEPVTTAADVVLARERLALRDVPLVGGSDANFAELNRRRELALAPPDGLAFALNPQVHDTDDRSIAESVSVHGDVIATAHAFARGLPIHVSPATLLPRGAPRADPRQASSLAAAWTAGSAAGLAAAGTASVTYFELSGDRGLVREGCPFPVYHVLRELCAWRGADLIALESSDPLRVTGLAVRTPGGVAAMVVNLTAGPIEVHAPTSPGTLALAPYAVTRIVAQS